jgi:hypothetical protein
MAIKYVKEFAHPDTFGFTGSAGKVAVKPHMRAAKAPTAPKAALAPKATKAPKAGKGC